MIPLVGDVRELRDQKTVVDRVAQMVMAEQGVTIDYLVGSMIEVPRGAITAGEIAEAADFLSFGTNDLTQMVFGFSRDDATKFLTLYQARKLIEGDPFASLDTVGVGALIKMGVERGRAAKPDLKVGICGEHAGDPASIRFFDSIGLDYVSAVAVPGAGGSARCRTGDPRGGGRRLRRAAPRRRGARCRSSCSCWTMLAPG